MRSKLTVALLAIPLSTILLIGLAVIAVHTRSFNRFVLAQFIAAVERSTGARIEVQSLKMTWSPFTAELLGIVAHGKEAANEAPLFRAERLAVRMGLRPLLKHQVNLY